MWRKGGTIVETRTRLLMYDIKISDVSFCRAATALSGSNASCRLCCEIYGISNDI